MCMGVIQLAYFLLDTYHDKAPVNNPPHIYVLFSVSKYMFADEKPYNQNYKTYSNVNNGNTILCSLN